MNFHRSIPHTLSHQGSDIIETHHLAILKRTGIFWKTPTAMDSALLFSETLCAAAEGPSRQSKSPHVFVILQCQGPKNTEAIIAFANLIS